MQSTKAMVIHQILKLNGKAFKLHNIYEDIGLTPQNTSNHLRALVTKGVLIKNGVMYTVPSQERLVDELTAEKGGIGMEEAQNVPFFYVTAKNHQYAIDQVVRARILDKPSAGELHVVMNQKIDATIEQMKRLKKWLNTKSYTIERAQKGFNEQEWEQVVKIVLGES